MESETVEDNKENIEYDQECPDKENEETEKSLPSKTDPTTETALPSENNNSTLCDNVTTVPESRGDYNEGNQNVSEQEQHGAGFADIDKYSKALGHETKNITSDSNMEKDIQSSSKRKKKPSQNPRTLGQLKENLLEVETIECSQSQEAKDSEECYKSDLYEHIQDPNSGYNIDVIDTASEQQINKENLINNDDINTSEEIETNLEENENETKIDAEENIYGKNISSTSEKQNIMSQKSDNDMEVDELPVEKSTDIIATSSVARGPNSSLHTQYDLWISLSEKRKLEELRLQLEHKIGSWIEVPDSEIQKNNLSKELWQQNIKVISPFVQEICEQLRLVLEPTKVSKLKGDYRTGKRLNMRKIIPYIASQFRKDKIWLRRTKPSIREYQIMLTVDDSSSMDDNKSRQLAMESVTLLGKSLSLLEVGQLSVVKFGEDVQLLHPFGEPFTDQAGIKVFQRFTFEQKKTRIAELLNYATTLMIDSRHGPVSRLMSKEIA
ncbi:midasin-like [Centruroides sculpturatus]|uniref:midasin-like n=1 Tax=Centruroides sculpturatus TaxID=218467 RepID=UPI000C6CDEE7|nr:midasin-like [Centruroides sculpturatus]